MKRTNRHKTGDLQVYWIPQVPMKAFTVDVACPAEAKKLLSILADYDQFQLDNNIKPDYSNAGGLNVFDAADKTDGPYGSWTTWYDDATGYDIDEWEPTP